MECDQSGAIGSTRSMMIRDYAIHLRCTHLDPVKHGYAERLEDWPFSSRTTRLEILVRKSRGNSPLFVLLTPSKFLNSLRRKRDVRR
jgi:hypothetical protein